MASKAKTTPQKPKSRKTAPPKKGAQAKAKSRKYNPSQARHSPDFGIIPSDNPNQAQTY